MSASKKIIAGKASGIKRAKLVKVRRWFVLSAYEQLQPKHRNQPYSLESLDALENEFRNPTTSGEFACDATGRRIGKAPGPWSERLEAMFYEITPFLPETLGSIKKHVGRETLIKDLKALGIKSKRSKKSRSG
jgi:hypothetical protein